jgi:hypothetical protein
MGESPVGNVLQRSRGAMIEVMLQVGGQLAKSTTSLPTPTFAQTASLAFHAHGEKLVPALQDRGKFSVGRF